MAKAAECYRKAAEAKDVHAQLNFALCCQSGQGVAQDDQEAFRYFTLAAAQGDTVAQYHTAIGLRDGKGTHHNLANAARYFEQSMLQGYPEARQALQELVKLQPELKSVIQNTTTTFFSLIPKSDKKSNTTTQNKQKCVMQ